MPTPGSDAQPLRVAIIGSGPAGFYVAQRLLMQKEHVVQVDMYDRLPAPFGLVRFGVAPDHQEIKAVTRVFDKVAAREGFRFFGNVDIGEHLTLDDLKRHYHQICFATGAQTDRRMGIPGEDLDRSHAATEFVAWYNGHPDYRDSEFDLSVERVAVVGVGNVAVDVARILCRSHEELAATDIADYALDALNHSRVKEVYMLGRRGPAQAAFTNPEICELGEMPCADIAVRTEEVELDDLTRAVVEERKDKSTNKKIEILQGFTTLVPKGHPRRLTVRFLVSPVELIGNDAGEVTGLRLVRNVLRSSENGTLRPKATDRFEELPVGMVFRSVGYHGIPLPDLPFDEKSGVVPNEKGGVVDLGGNRIAGIYVSGWIKRGPTGVIGTNKPDAAQTVRTMLEDRGTGNTLDPASPDPQSIERLIRDRSPAFVSYADWQALDRLEIERGEVMGKPRAKFVTADEMLAALNRA